MPLVLMVNIKGGKVIAPSSALYALLETSIVLFFTLYCRNLMHTNIFSYAPQVESCKASGISSDLGLYSREFELL